MVSERQLSVSTHAVDDTDTVWLGTLGQVDAIRYTHTYPGGSAAFNANLSVAPTFRHRGLIPGRLLRVWCGGVCVWKGTLDRPAPGDTLALSGTGNASAGEDFTAWYTDNSFKCQPEVANAISRGLPWKPAPVYPPVWGVTGQASKTIAETVQYTADFAGRPWTVNVEGQLAFNPPPTSPSLMLLALSSGGGRATENYADMLIGVYNALLPAPDLITLTALAGGGSLAADTYYYRITALDLDGNETTGSNEVSHAATAGGRINLSWNANPNAFGFNIYRASSAAWLFLGGQNTWVDTVVGTTTYTDYGRPGKTAPVPKTNSTKVRAITTATNLGSIAKHGRREAMVDYTGYGNSDAGKVHTSLLPILAKFGYRARWSAPFTCPAGSIRSLGGAPVDLAFVRPGAMVGVQVVDADGGGEVDPAAVMFIAGEAEYNADDDTLQLTPQESTLTDLASLTVDSNPRKPSRKG